MATCASTADLSSKQKTFGEKLAQLLKQFPNECDVTFIVGPQKTKIKSSRLALMASSPSIHTMFRDTWDTAVTNQGEGISLPNFEHNAFEAFLKILMSDDWTPAGIKEMNLPTDIVFKMIEIAKKFKVLDLQQSLEESTREFFENFPSFVKSKQFLQLSRETLEIVLSINFISLDEVYVFNAALYWAKWQCYYKGQTQTGENWRHVLGPALFQIRFPLMTVYDFCNVVGTTGILLETEEFKMLKFLSLSEQNRLTFDAGNFPFKTVIRQSALTALISLTGVRTLKFFENSQIVNSPSFECNGVSYGMILQVDARIAIESVGFLGPVDYDSVYETQVEINKRNYDGSLTCVQKVKKTLKAKRKEKFEVAFDPPVVLEATYIREEFNYTNSPFYFINYSLKGHNTQTGPGMELQFRREVLDTGFYCRISSDPRPLQFMKFKTV